MKVVNLLVKQPQSQVSKLYNIPSSKRAKSSCRKLYMIWICLFGIESERVFSKKGWMVQQHSHLENSFGRISDGNINSNSILERIKKKQTQIHKINYECRRYFTNKSMVFTHCLHLSKLRLHLCLICELTHKKQNCSKKHFRQPSNCKLFNSINMEKFKFSWLVCILTVHLPRYVQGLPKYTFQTYLPYSQAGKNSKLSPNRQAQLEIHSSRAGKWFGWILLDLIP